MKSMFDVLEKKRVKIGGIRQNCYALDVRTDSTDLKKNKFQTMKSYFSLEEKKLPNGYVQEIEKKDYPINSDSVTSYASGADYRRDPMGAVANAPKRVNLGDIAQVQDFVATNPQEAVRILRDVNKTLSNYLSTKKDIAEDTGSSTSSTPNGSASSTGNE